MTTQISVRIPEADADAIDELVIAGFAKSRSAFVSLAVREAVVKLGEAMVAAQYERAYADQPTADDEAWILEAGRRVLQDDA